MLNEIELLPSEGRGDFLPAQQNSALDTIDDGHTESGTELLPAAPSLTPKQLAFSRAVCDHGNASRAYRETYDTSGMNAGTIRRHAYRLMHRPDVAEVVRDMQAAAAEGTTVSLRSRIVSLQQLAEADASEIVQIRTFACRHCWGFQHRYQWCDENELAIAHEEAEQAIMQGATTTKRPDPRGGFGYSPALEPREDCPRCLGLGETRTVLTPSSEWSPAARKLFKSARMKSDGTLEIEMESRAAASEQLARLSGWNVERSESRSVSLSMTADLALANDPAALLAAYKRVIPK